MKQTIVTVRVYRNNRNHSFRYNRIIRVTILQNLVYTTDVSVITVDFFIGKGFVRNVRGN
jgi:hypothetical protein